MAKSSGSIFAALIVLSAAVSGTAHAAIDADAAKALAKANDCLKCHALDKTKKGPSLKAIAAKYQGKADGPEKGLKNITVAHTVKLEDGTEEEHKTIDSKDIGALKNLVAWILSQK